MKFIRLYTTLAAALLLGSCSNEANDANDAVDPNNVPISLACSLQEEQETRAYSTTQSAQLTDGQTVSVWCDEHVAAGHATDVTDYVKGWQLTVNSGNLSGTNTYYFPKSGNSLCIYALHGNFNNAVTEGTTTWSAFTSGLTHTVVADQNTSAADYLKSDLLYAVKHEVAKTKTAQTLNFKHLMAKIEINLYCGAGITQADLTGATVQILNTKTTANLILSKSAPLSSTISVSGAAATIKAKMQSGDELIEVPDVLTPGSNKNEHAYLFAEAIVAPQKFDTNYDGTGTGMQLIQVTMADSSTRKTKAATYIFEAGKRYVFNVKVGSGGLELTNQINNWSPDTTAPIDIPMM